MPDEGEISGSVPQGHVKQDQSGVEDEEREQQEDDRLHVEKRVAKGELATRVRTIGGERLARGCHGECLVEITRPLSSRSLEQVGVFLREGLLLSQELIEVFRGTGDRRHVAERFGSRVHRLLGHPLRSELVKCFFSIINWASSPSAKSTNCLPMSGLGACAGMKITVEHGGALRGMTIRSFPRADCPLRMALGDHRGDLSLAADETVSDSAPPVLTSTFCAASFSTKGFRERLRARRTNAARMRSRPRP